MFSEEPACKLNDRRDWITLLHSALPYTIHLHTSKKPTRFFHQKNQLPKSLYLREVGKITSQHVHGAEMDASNSHIIRSHCRLNAEPSQCISSIRPTLWQCFCAAHLPITPTQQGEPMCKKAWKQQQKGQHTRAFSSGDRCTKKELALLFVWICVHAHTRQWLLVISSSICHALPQCPPHFNSIILFMSFCFLAHCKCVWILQQEWNKSEAVLLPDSYGIILSQWSDIHLKNRTFPCLPFWNE